MRGSGEACALGFCDSTCRLLGDKLELRRHCHSCWRDSGALGLHHTAQRLPSQCRSAGFGDAPNNILPRTEGSCLFAYIGFEYGLEGECLCGSVLGFGSKRPDRT